MAIYTLYQNAPYLEDVDEEPIGSYSTYEEAERELQREQKRHNLCSGRKYRFWIVEEREV